MSGRRQFRFDRRPSAEHAALQAAQPRTRLGSAASYLWNGAHWLAASLAVTRGLAPCGCLAPLAPLAPWLHWFLGQKSVSSSG